MGCCMSSSPKKNGHRSPSSKPPPATPPPPPPLEEETVKEVLSETPISRNPPLPPPPPLPSSPAVTEHKAMPMDILYKTTTQQPREPVNTRSQREEEEERTPEVSQQSEIRSYSTATTATTATTLTEIARDQDEATSKNRVVNKSTLQQPHRKRNHTNTERDRVARSPVKRGVSGNGQATRTTSQRNVGSRTGGVIKRDVGEGSGRRSRSPATRGGVGRGRGGGSPARRVGGRGSERVGKSGELSGKLNEEEENKNDNVSMQQQQQEQKKQHEEGNESLDNPLVSLECFIFL